MQLGTAKERIVKKIHNDGETSFLLLAEDWLNEIMLDIVSRSNSWSWLEADGSLAIVAGTSSYAISSIGSDVSRILTLSIDEPGLVFKPKDAFTFTIMNSDPDSQSGTPRMYTIWGDNILLSPVPDEDDTVAVKYYKHVTELTDDSDTPPWPTRFDRVWLTGAYAMALEYKEDERAELKYAAYERLIKEMMGGDGLHIDEEIISSPYSRQRLGGDIDFDPTGPLAGILF